MASFVDEDVPMLTTAPAVPSSRTPPSLMELSRKSTRLSLIPYVRRLACQTPQLGLRVVSLHVSFLHRRISVSEDYSEVDETVASGKDQRIPASKEAIEALPTVDVVEKGSECAICLKEIGSRDDEIVKKMPCEHTYHWECIEKWLGIHRSCPVCRYEMPLEGEEDGDNKENELNGNEEGINEGDDDADDDEAGYEDEEEDCYEEVERRGESYENGVLFNYAVDGSNGDVLDVEFDVVTIHNPEEYENNDLVDWDMGSGSDTWM